jgi:hypothetical protein
MDDGAMHLPDRHPDLATREMLVSFDIDCGELVPRHHLVARGLARSVIWDRLNDPNGTVRAVDFLYDLVPGLARDEEDEHGFFPYLVEFIYRADRRYRSTSDHHILTRQNGCPAGSL